MLVGVDHSPSRETEEDQYAAEPEKVDPATLAPLCSEAEFAELVGGMVADEAPGLFAVVQEYGTRVDGRIAAWGMAFEDHVELVRAGGLAWISLPSPERAADMLSHRPHITARLVWVTAGESSSPQETGAA